MLTVYVQFWRQNFDCMVEFDRRNHDNFVVVFLLWFWVCPGFQQYRTIWNPIGILFNVKTSVINDNMIVVVLYVDITQLAFQKMSTAFQLTS